MARPNIINGENGESCREKINAIGRRRGSFSHASTLPDDDVVAGDWWYNEIITNFDGEDWPPKTIFLALEDEPGQDPALWRPI